MRLLYQLWPFVRGAGKRIWVALVVLSTIFGVIGFGLTTCAGRCANFDCIAARGQIAIEEQRVASSNINLEPHIRVLLNLQNKLSQITRYSVSNDGSAAANAVRLQVEDLNRSIAYRESLMEGDKKIRQDALAAAKIIKDAMLLCDCSDGLTD